MIEGTTLASVVGAYDMSQQHVLKLGKYLTKSP
jgi:hypothetical protein